jgi:hypothetical protein
VLRWVAIGAVVLAWGVADAVGGLRSERALLNHAAHGGKMLQGNVRITPTSF